MGDDEAKKGYELNIEMRFEMMRFEIRLKVPEIESEYEILIVGKLSAPKMGTDVRNGN